MLVFFMEGKWPKAGFRTGFLRPRCEGPDPRAKTSECTVRDREVLKRQAAWKLLSQFVPNNMLKRYVVMRESCVVYCSNTRHTNFIQFLRESLWTSDSFEGIRAIARIHRQLSLSGSWTSHKNDDLLYKETTGSTFSACHTHTHTHWVPHKLLQPWLGWSRKIIMVHDDHPLSQSSPEAPSQSHPSWKRWKQ